MKLSGRTLLVTGGTGSFGNAIVSKLADTDIGQIRIFSRDEKKQDDMRRKFQNPKLKFYLGDIRSYDSISEAAEGADYAFHAAALKQVPSCEFYPMEAIRTNILGADNLLRAAIAKEVRVVVVLSTDKAVYPINAMGQSKALMEKLMLAHARIATDLGLVFCGTRYGNVLGSRGSVVPLFASQIAQGEPLTITDPGMTRFMMNMGDAIDLVLFAFHKARPGDRFVHKAPAATIGNVATAIKRLLKSDCPEKIIGTRHGEKRFEMLMSPEELCRSEDMGDYYRIPWDNRSLDYDKYFSEGMMAESRDGFNSENTRQLDVPELMKLMSDLPEIQEMMK